MRLYAQPPLAVVAAAVVAAVVAVADVDDGGGTGDGGECDAAHVPAAAQDHSAARAAAVPLAERDNENATETHCTTETRSVRVAQTAPL